MARTKALEKKALGGTGATKTLNVASPPVIKTEGGALVIKIKKRRRRKRIKAEIKRLQTGKECTRLLASRASISRLSREIIANYGGSTMRVTPRALEALQIAAEEAVTEAMAKSNMLAKVVGGREGPLVRDLQATVAFMPHLMPR